MPHADFPPKALPLFQPARYKVMYGGRGGAKSWAAARALTILAAQKKLFVLCAREIQKSIKDSVYKLLVDQINELGMGHLYEPMDDKIVNKETGSIFRFAGVRNNISSIKSMEAIDICWVEEATDVTEVSWGVLLPTIRRDPPHGPFGQGSEIWVTFNPELAEDYTYKFWVLDPPSGTVLMEMNYHDNPWFPDVLRDQAIDLRARDYESYLTIFEGKVRRVMKGAIYAKELEAAQREGRISPDVRPDRLLPVDIGVDLGRADMTALWFVQQAGLSLNVVDYYSNFGFDWAHYLEQIQMRRHIIGKIYLPHDAAHKNIAARHSIETQTRQAYPGDDKVRIVPRTPNVVLDINAVRAIFPRLAFNEKSCGDGLQMLAHYRYDVDPETKEVSPRPLHDIASHAADALRTYVMGLKAHGEGKLRPQRLQTHAPVRVRGLSWLGT